RLHAEALVAAGWTSAVAFPIAAGDKTMGALVLGEVHEALRPDTSCFVETAAGIVALHLSRFDEVKAKRDRDRELRAANQPALGVLVPGLCVRPRPDLVDLSRPLAGIEGTLGAAGRSITPPEMAALRRQGERATNAFRRLRRAIGRLDAAAVPDAAEVVDA